jgi:putative heme degradation protein
MTMTPDDVGDIKSNIGKLFDKISELGEAMAINSTILNRVDDTVKCLPCKHHQELIQENVIQIKIIKNFWIAIVAILGMTGTVLGIIAIGFRLYASTKGYNVP